MEAVEKTDVLFQKMGNIWFIFSVINGESLYSMLPNGINPKSESVEIYQIIEAHKRKEVELQAS